MVLDFDVKTFIQNLRATKPPYECPVRTCRKVYKSFSGIQFHMLNHNHDCPDSPSAAAAASPSGGGRKPGKRKSKNWNPRHVRRSPSPQEFMRSPQRETISYAESQRSVEVDLDGCLKRIDIYQPLQIISQDEIENHDNTEKEENLEKSPSGRTVRAVDTKGRKDAPAVAIGSLPPDINPNKLPEARVKVLTDYVKPEKVSARPSAYYRYIEKTFDELDEEVEYDMDEEDHSWLELVNARRTSDGIAAVAQDTFEIILDRFEKEAFFQGQNQTKDQGPSMDDDAVCSICMDGECQNSNMILFCDMCNLAVHQECYGVPYIPEGQWLCRRCLQSPSRAVDCCLCPNKGGAFKQTDDGRWAHVVCALWIPEVGFANTVFLEPIDCLQRIPPARRKLTCYICKQRGAGACIQCHKTNCYTAFHVTCAQQAGLFMRIEAVKESGPKGISMGVRKTAFCDVHAEPSADNSMFPDEDGKKLGSKEEAREQARLKMRKARKILAQKRNAIPNVSIPIIPEQRVTKISTMISIPRKDEFMRALMSYWTLKRQSRFGVPLLRRLQSNHMSRSRDSLRNDKQSQEIREKLKYWQRLRQDLEKARLLVELIRKREKLKRELLRVYELSIEHKLQPFVMLLRSTLSQLQEKDTEEIFAHPVSEEEAPDYRDVIKHPMCFSVMRQKIDTHRYKTVEAFESDFKLIIHNCCAYNAKDTVFYKEALLLKEEGLDIIKDAKNIVERIGYDPKTGLHADPEIIKAEKLEKVDKKGSPPKKQQSPSQSIKSSYEEQLKDLLSKVDNATKTMKGSKKVLFLKKMRSEIAVVRRKLALDKKKPIVKKGKQGKAKVKARPVPKGRKKLKVEEVKEEEDDAEEEEEEEDEKPDLSVKEEEKEKDFSEDDMDDSPPQLSPAPTPLPSTPTTSSSKSPRGASGGNSTSKATPPTPSSPPSSPSPAPISSQRRRSSVRGGSVGRGRGRGRGGRGSRSSISQADKSESPHGSANKASKDQAKSSPSSPVPDRSDSKESVCRGSNNSTHTPSPAGVNRRTAVLFNSKKGRTSTPVPSTPPTSSNNNNSNASSTNTPSSTSTNTANSNTNATTSTPTTTTPKKPSGRGGAKTRQQLEQQVAAEEEKKQDNQEPLSVKVPDLDSSEMGTGSSVAAADVPISPRNRAVGPISPTGRKRSASTAGFNQQPHGSSTSGNTADSAIEGVPAAKKASVSTTSLTNELPPTTSSSVGGPDIAMDSFKAYRVKGHIRSSSESESSDELSSGDEESLSGDMSESSSGQLSPGAAESRERPRRSSTCLREGPEGSDLAESTELSPATSPMSSGRTRRSPSIDSEDLIQLEPLDLVWAKCRGYPWYPALIINPKMPKTGYFHNGVPIPVPPDDVLELQQKYAESVYLVLFFDTKRTWQWLPRSKLEPLGVNSDLDKSKLMENKKPNVRNAVKKAYEKAIVHRCRVRGDPNPLSDDSSSDNNNNP